MNRNKEIKWAAILGGVFILFYFLPIGNPRFDGALHEALELTRWYAREHVILCLLPAFWIAGAIAAFVSQGSVMRYLGPNAPKPLAYGVGAVSGTILAVCSCTVLPLFAGIYRMGAGLGPATAFLYSGPAINALAIILTAKILGVQLGAARAISAILFSVVIGLIMAFLFRNEERIKAAKAAHLPEVPEERPLWKTASFFASLLGVLVFANWGSGNESTGLFSQVFAVKWIITSGFALTLGFLLWRWFGLSALRLVVVGCGVAATAWMTRSPNWAFLAGIFGMVWLTAGRQDEAGDWFEQSWSYTKQIMPLLLGGVLVAGLLLGRPGQEGLIPSGWIAQAVGGESLGANAFASIAGAFMYFATLTEIPILQGLLGNGMGDGPALALLLAGPALSLPNMLVIRSIIGTRKTAAYVILVIFMATITGWLFGRFV
jgi:uncharacterized protein